MHSVLEAIGQALRCAQLFFVASPSVALLACWFAAVVARRDRGTFEFSDGLIFGSLGGGVGGLLAAVGCADLFRTNTRFSDGVSLGGSGLLLGALIGGAAAIVTVWRRERRRRNSVTHRDPAA